MNKLNLILALGVLVLVTSGCSSTRGWYHLPAAEFDEIDYRLPVKTVTVRNLDVAYIEAGAQNDQVLILLHGLGSNAKAWLRNMEAWGEQYHVIAVDLPGYGRSTKGALPYSLSFYAQVVVEMLDALEVESAVLGGHSMGGQIAIIAGLEYPERVDRLVLFSPAGVESFEEGEGQWLSGALTPEFVHDTTIRNIAANLHANFHRTPSEAEFMITDRIRIRGASDFDEYCYAVSRNVAAMIDEPTSGRLGEITQPVLVVFAENDGLIPNPYLHGGRTSKVADIARSEIPGCELLLVPECGHFVQFERPDVVNPAVLEFLGSAPAAGR
jgi:pimeloyl-ACP methyl ester carboxylesterase